MRRRPDVGDQEDQGHSAALGEGQPHAEPGCAITPADLEALRALRRAFGSDATPSAAPITLLAPAEMVRPELFAAMTGISTKAVAKKIEDGVWRAGHEVFKAPDGKWLVSLPGFYAWAKSPYR